MVLVTVTGLQFGHSYNERRSFDLEDRKASEMSVTGSVSKVVLILLEGEGGEEGPAPLPAQPPPSRHTILNVTLHHSTAIYSITLSTKREEKLMVEVGPLVGDVPMHPGFLHGVVIRTSRNLQREMGKLGMGLGLDGTDGAATDAEAKDEEKAAAQAPPSAGQRPGVGGRHGHPVSLNVSVATVRLKAQLLPSVWARYELSAVRCLGTVGPDAKLAVQIPSQGIEFCVASSGSTEGGGDTPRPIQLQLPGFAVDVDRLDGAQEADKTPRPPHGEHFVCQQGEYWKVEVSVGSFEHTLTTYLLNQILFVQEAFRREVGEILSRITGERGSFGTPTSSPRPKAPILYELSVKGPAQGPVVQVTATTPTATALRLTVEGLSGRLTNRWVSGASAERILGKVELGLSLVLGQLVKAAAYEEVEAEFQHFAYFKTRVQMQNVQSSSASDTLPGSGGTMEAGTYTYIVRVIRPMVFVQKSGVDKAVLLWLNYKNTYNFWSKERHQLRSRGTGQPSLRRNSLTPTNPLSWTVSSPTSPEELGQAPLFLKLTVDEGLYVCMPLMASAAAPDCNAALLLSLDKTHISVASLGSLVSEGSFTGFCVRLAEDFDAVSEDWRLDAEQRRDSNSCYVPEGTYQVCSRTTASPAPEWLLNVQWQMKGMDMQLNSRMGTLAKMLLSTITSLAEDQPDDHHTVPGSSDQAWMSVGSEAAIGGGGSGEAEEAAGGAPPPAQGHQDWAPPRPPARQGHVRQPSLCPPIRAHLNETCGRWQLEGASRTAAMEAGMNEQALLVSALRGSKEASEATIEIERRRLARWEAALFADFRREMRDKFRRQSQKATSLRDRLGLSMKAPTTGALDRSLPNALGPAVGHRHSVRHSDPGGHDASLTARRQSDTSGFARGLVRGGGHQRANSFDASGSSELLPPILAASREVSVEEDLDGWREWSEEGSREGSNSTGGSRGSVRWRSDDSPARPGGQRGRNEAADWEEAQAAAGAEASAPGVNIYLDVKIIIESGALHLSTLPKGPQEEETTPKAKLAKSKSRSKVGQPAAVTKTVIAMPSLSLRSYYTSQAAQGTLNPSIVKEARLGEGVAEALGRSSKRAQFYLYTALESMPEETLITPHIMQFFEDTLEPLGTASAGGWQSEGEASGRLSSLGWGEMSDTNDPDTATDDQDEGDAPAPSVLVGPASSVNVEVILYFLVQSSTLRFTTTANPSVTGVECLLRLPSLHLAFTRRDAPDEPDEALGGGIHCSASFKVRTSSSSRRRCGSRRRRTRA